MRITKLLYGACLVVLLGCAAPAAAPAPSPNLGGQYLALVAPSNTALDQLYAAAQATPMDGVKVRAAAKTLFDADVTFNTALLAFEKKVPANVVPHIEAARAADSKEIADLQRVVSSTDDATLNSALAVFGQDAQADSAAFVLLRSDLGLPPPSLASPTPSPSA